MSGGSSAITALPSACAALRRAADSRRQLHGQRLARLRRSVGGRRQALAAGIDRREACCGLVAQARQVRDRDAVLAARGAQREQALLDLLQALVAMGQLMARALQRGIRLGQLDAGAIERR